MKKMKTIKWKECAPFVLTGCIIALFYLTVSHLGTVLGGVGKFLGFFSTIIAGAVMAYLINSPACFFYNKVLKNVKSEKKRWMLSVVIAFVVVLLFIAISIAILIPQMVDSVTLFINNLESYQATVHSWAQKLGLSELFGIDYSNMAETSEKAMNEVLNYIIENSSKIMSDGAAAGKGVFNFIIALILSIYFLAGKEMVANFIKRVMNATLSDEKNESALIYFSRCNTILSRYVVYNIIDALIIGGINAVFMIITGMPYVGLISLIVGLTNLIPSFGPVIGLVICGFILVLISPKILIIFAIFTLVLQTCDAYIIKPKLFGDSLGISGMLIISGVIVGGKIAGVAGILLATPVVAIIDFTIKEHILPKLEAKKELSTTAEATDAE